MRKHSHFLFLFLIIAVVFAVLGNRFWFPTEQVRAQTTGLNTESQEQKVVAFFRDLEQPNIMAVSVATAFDTLFRDGSQISRTSAEEVETMSKSYLGLSSPEVAGRLYDYEKLPSKPLGKDVIFLKYLSKHENAPVLWTFQFYRSPRVSSTGTSTVTSTVSSAGWILNSVRFDTEVESAL